MGETAARARLPLRGDVADRVYAHRQHRVGGREAQDVAAQLRRGLSVGGEALHTCETPQLLRLQGALAARELHHCRVRLLQQRCQLAGKGLEV